MKEALTSIPENKQLKSKFIFMGKRKTINVNLISIII